MQDVETGLALVIATVIPLIFLFTIYKRNLYSTGSVDVVVLCFIWGVAVYFLALLIHNLPILNIENRFLTLTRFIAPVSEEILKALILLVLVRRTAFTYFVDGVIYGFAIGIGFAIVESYSYILDHESAALSIAIARTISSNLVHATASALVGVALGLARFERGAVRQVPIALGGLIAAILLHGGFNNLLTRVWAGTPLLMIYAGITGACGSLMVVWIIQRGLAEERGWIEETLETTDRITKGEAEAVKRLAEAGVILAPLVEHFGQEKAAQIGRMLILQARLGILRKTLEKLDDEQLRQDVEAQYSAIEQRMNASRHAVGAYPMLYLRNIFAEKRRSVWRRLRTIVAGHDDTSGISVAHMLADLPTPERCLMRQLMRHRRSMSRANLGEIIGQLPEDKRLTPGQVDGALENLVTSGLVTCTDGLPVQYRVALRRKPGLTLNEDIWAMLDDLLVTPSTSATDVWGVLRSRLDEQAQAAGSTGSENIWAVLTRRIKE